MDCGNEKHLFDDSWLMQASTIYNCDVNLEEELLEISIGISLVFSVAKVSKLLILAAASPIPHQDSGK